MSDHAHRIAACAVERWRAVRQERLDVLVVDDERNIRTTLSLCLEEMGCRVTAVGTAQAAREAVERQSFDVAFVDLRSATRAASTSCPSCSRNGRRSRSS